MPIEPPRRKIISRISGGIGNQLFMYAAARRLAITNSAELILDDVSGFERDLEYRRQYQLHHFNIRSRKASSLERFEPFPRTLRYLKRRWNQRLPFELRTYCAQEGIDFDPRLLSLRSRRNLYLEGYWQSENYFKDVEATIREDLRIKPPGDECNQNLANDIQNHTSIAVHTRFFEPPSEAGSYNISGKYYQRALQAMEKLVPGAHYYLFSDNPEASRAQVPMPDSRVTLVSHNLGDENAYADLWLMSQCQHFIIANSTFSWWGAWLAANQGKIVVAPDIEMRDGVCGWGFKGLIPSDWIVL